MTKGTGASRTWHDDPQVWHFVFVRYLVFFGPMNLLWEIAQLPLYTLWTQAPPPSIAYAVIHCTLGDILIAVLALLAALGVTRAGPLDRWRWRRIGALSASLIRRSASASTRPCG